MFLCFAHDCPSFPRDLVETVVPNSADMAEIVCVVYHCDWAKIFLDIDLDQVAYCWQMTVDL